MSGSNFAKVMLAVPSLSAARAPLVPGPTAKVAWTAKVVVRTFARTDPSSGEHCLWQEETESAWVVEPWGSQHSI